MSTQPYARPTTADVARLLRARTKNEVGEELGVFGTDTRPTEAEVDALITVAEGDVLTQTGADLEGRTGKEAASMISLRTAMFVELSYWPEQVRSDRSPYEEYKRLYDEGMTALLESISSGSGEDGGTVDRYTHGSLPVRSWTRTATHSWPGDPEFVPAPVNPPA